MFACSDCSHKSRDAWKMLRHLMTHSEEKPFRCNHCGILSATKGSLFNHLRRHYRSTCRHCQVQCNSKVAMKEHMEEKHGPTVECPDCAALVLSESFAMHQSKCRDGDSRHDDD